MNSTIMTGAILLATIGMVLASQGRMAGTAEAAYVPRGSGSYEHRSNRLAGADCPTIEVLEPFLRPFGGECETVAYWPERSFAEADVLNSGLSQTWKMPQILGDPSSDPTRVRPGYVIRGSGVERLALDWSSLDYKSVGIDLSGFGNSGERLCGIAWIDIDEDGRLDLVLKGPQTGSNAPVFAWLRNIYNGPARLPADLNHDGRVDGQDLGELFVQWTG